MIVTVRGLVRAGGQKIGGCDTKHFVDRAKAASLGGDEALRALISPLIELLEQVAKQLAVLDAELEARSKADPLVEQLTSAPGVGPVIATAYISVIDSAKRFRTAHQVAAYVGLVPKEDSSGGRRKLGSITKQGNAYLRSLLVQAAWNVMRQRADDPIKTWAQAVAKRRGKRVAVVAVARRLAGVLWAMWRDGTLYHAPEVAAASADGMKKNAKRIQRRAEQIAAITQ
jgi:transposase